MKAVIKGSYAINIIYRQIEVFPDLRQYVIIKMTQLMLQILQDREKVLLFVGRVLGQYGR